MDDLELVIKCPECGNIGIDAHNTQWVPKEGKQQVRCINDECRQDFYRIHPEFIIKALTEKVKELEKTVDSLLSWKESVNHDLQSINKEIAELQK